MSDIPRNCKCYDMSDIPMVADPNIRHCLARVRSFSFLRIFLGHEPFEIHSLNETVGQVTFLLLRASNGRGYLNKKKICGNYLCF